MIYVIIILSFVILIVLSWDYYQCINCKNWKTTEGEIVYFNLKNHGKNNTYKIPQIVYNFTLNKKLYSSSKVSIALFMPVKNDEADLLAEKYPVGKKVIVSFHPKFNSYSVLETKIKKPNYYLSFIISFLVVLIVSLLTLFSPEKIMIFELINWIKE